MATPTDKHPSKFQAELQDASNGLTNNNLSLLNSMMILGVLMAKAEIITKLKAYLQLFIDVNVAKAAYLAAVVKRKAALVEMRDFYLAFVMALKQTLGPANQGQLPGFGIMPPTARALPTPETKALAKVKAAATRKARGTQGKKQKLAIKPSTNVSFQVLGADGTPYDPSSVSGPAAPAPSGAATPSTSSTPVTSGGTGHTP